MRGQQLSRLMFPPRCTEHIHQGERGASPRQSTLPTACDHTSPHTESPVHILNPQDKVSLTFTTSEQVVLTCELSRVDFPASWYKDGQKVDESESLVVKMDGRKHCLVLPAAEVRDSGEFECRTEGVSAFFSVTIQGQEPWQPRLLQLRLTLGAMQVLPPGLLA